jgi:hypothetical protein
VLERIAGSVQRISLLSMILFVPMLHDRVCDLGEPGTVFHQFQNIRRRKELNSVRRWVAKWLEQLGGDEDRHIMRLTAKQPADLLHREPRRGLPDERHKLMLFFFHANQPLPDGEAVSAFTARQMRQPTAYRVCLQATHGTGGRHSVPLRPPRGTLESLSRGR